MGWISKLSLWLKNLWRGKPDAIIATAANQPTPKPVELPTPKPVEPPTPKPAVDPETRKRRRQLRQIVKHRQLIADEVDTLITKLSNLTLDLCDDHSYGRGRAMNDLASDLLGCDFHLLSDLTDILDEDMVVLNVSHPDEQQLHTLAELVDMFWPIDVASVVRKEGYYFIERLVSATSTELRGKARMFVPRMLRSIHGELNDDNTWWLEERIFGFINHQWRPLDTGMDREATHNARGALIGSCEPTFHQTREISDSTAITFSLLLTDRYQWHVALGTERDGPRILLPTNPAGCQAIFRDRDLPIGKSRRTALRHWVVRHYRETGDTGIAFVREHLRGATDFKWCELDGEILVSAFDLEKNEAFRLEAEHWRSTRKHNRFKVRLKRKTTTAEV